MTADRNGTPKWATQVSHVPAFAPVKLRLASGLGLWIGFLIRASLVLLFFIRLSSLCLLSVCLSICFVYTGGVAWNKLILLYYYSRSHICTTTLFHWSRRRQSAPTDGISNTIKTFQIVRRVTTASHVNYYNTWLLRYSDAMRMSFVFFSAATHKLYFALSYRQTDTSINNMKRTVDDTSNVHKSMLNCKIK